MSIIKHLDNFTINQIAAGEIIERPASVVKELVENSIDAKAEAITLEIKDGGIAYIRVTDNGIGMDKEDALMSFSRHATSKISEAEDLEYISSLGFRGEALASIVAVSRVEMYTRESSSLAGYHIINHGGNIVDEKEAGCPEGTTIVIRNLFYNAPARLKFLKTTRSESAAISDLISKFILAHPKVSFKYINNGKLIYRSPGDNSLKNAILSVYGQGIGDELLYINKQNDSIGLSLSGYLGKPSLSRTNKKHQSFFVNGRYVKSKLLSQCIGDAVSEVMMINHFPWAVLNIKIPPNNIDINVHPSKTEIRFDNDKEVYGYLFNWVSKAIEDKSNIPKINASELRGRSDTVYNDIKAIPITDNESLNINEVTQGEKATVAKHEEVELDIKNDHTPIQIDILEEDEISIEDDANDNTKKNYDFMGMRVIGSVFNTYILAELDKELYIIDQHAAHERLLYERIKESIKKRDVLIQKISPSHILEVTNAEYTHVISNLDVFSSTGFEIEPFGKNSFIIRGLPHLFKDINIKELFNKVLDSLYQSNTKMDNDFLEEDIIKMACRQAVKANDKLGYKEIIGLLRDINLNKIPLTCPHGRPIMTSMSQYELEKKFKRIQ